ncbi:MAG: hypothetical protein KER_03495 [Kerstersia gyiorum]|uniref:TetR/AcrR family transcriptional regulator n=1 Tax=Kerstersia gyiorum TaxID=206506 RepID=UPI0030CC65D0
METVKPAPRRGRPPSITRQRIAEAGMAMGLPRMTFVGVAALLGVSHIALYKHVQNLEALKRLVAEEIFCRWQMPETVGPLHEPLEAYLHRFSASLRELVRRHQGLAPYLIRRSATTPTMLDKIYAHHEWFAGRYGLTRERARWLLSTIAFHCIALADTVYAVSADDDVPLLDDETEAAEIEAEFDRGMQALVIGVLHMPS